MYCVSLKAIYTCGAVFFSQRAKSRTHWIGQKYQIVNIGYGLVGVVAQFVEKIL